ncbi:MAG: FG-GAP-like repeat-containing protein [Candidatus Omnitrophota bacterium]|nr:FG-GAP-like repeat-containing protein [Candidatus Omnitrophota bacterium]
MRNLRIALLVIGTIASLISFKDKGVVNLAHDAKPIVAEAYHSLQSMLPPPVAAGLSALSRQVMKSQIPSSSSIPSPVELIANDTLADDNIQDIVAGAPADIKLQNTATPVTDNQQPAPAPVETIVYGMTGTVLPEDSTGNTNTNAITDNNNSIETLTAQSSPSPSNIFIASITPNSGIAGTSVIIQGAGFDSNLSNNVVKFGNVSSSSATYVSKNQLRATIPQGLSAGFTNLSVSVNGTPSNLFLFDILKNTSGNIFADDTQNILPAGLAITDLPVVRTADVDNDNDLDLFMIDTFLSSVYVLINDGNGNFTNETSSTLPAIADPSSITDAVFGDTNQDGHQDIVLAYSSGQSVRILLNSGLGSFSDVTALNLPAVSGNAVSLDLGDANGDGAPDIIIANKNTRDILLINNSGGVFSKDAGFNLPGVIDGSSDIRFCDLNSDGAVDIITANNEVVDTSSLRNRVYVNNGLGQFTDNTEIMLPGDNEYSEVLDYGDVDGDGDIDVVVANHDQNSILINDGAGIFTDETSARIPTNYFVSKDTKLGDVNGDGYLDIVMLGEDKMSLLINDGQGSFTEGSIKLPDYKSIPALLGGKDVQVADINGDGALDIIVAGNSLRFLINSASNKAPVLDSIGDRKIEFGKKLEFNVTGSDPNDDALIFLAENLPDGAAFLSKMFRWVPAANDIGQHKNVRFIAREDTPAALEAFEDITITVVGLPPIIDSYIPKELDLNLGIGEIVQFGIIAYDPTGGALTFKWFLNSVQVKSVSGFKSSLIFIVPRIGENIIEARVENGTGNDSVYWDVSVGVTQNRPPQIIGYEPQESAINIDPNAGGAFNFAVTASDPDVGDSISYTWKFDDNVLSSGAALSSSAFAGSASVGNHALQVSVSDGHNAAVTRSWTINITVIPAYTLTINAVNGSVSMNPNKTTYSAGEEVAITATPDTGYTFNSWSGDVSGTTNPAIITMNANKTVTANFTVIPPVAITASAQAGGSISPSGTVSVAYGTNQTFTVTADTGYSIDQVLVDGLAVTLSNGTYTFNNVTAAHTISASFVSSLSISDQIIQKSFNYFWNETDNPETGFTRDRLAVKSEDRTAAFDVHYNRASLAATGFQLAALCAADNDPNIAGTVTHDQLEARATLIMDKLLDIQGKQNPDDQATWAKWGKDGFFYHFVDIDTGERYSGSEVSTIDTAIVVAGAITAGNHFGGDLKNKAMDIYRNVNWKAFLDTNPIVLNHHDAVNPSYNNIYHAWDPETVANGGFYGHWDYTNESLILYLLATVSPADNYAVPADVFYTIRRELGNYGQNSNPIVKSWDGALFEYQYTQAFFNFKDASGNPLYDGQGVNWWDNSVEATRANKQFCNYFINKFAAQEDLWGLTAGYTDGLNYGVYGAPPAGLAVTDPDGTVFPAAVAGSLPFLPDEVMRALNKMKELYDDYNYPIWGDYGFVNSFKLGGSLNDTPSPVSIFYCGIDVGIALVMAENQKSGLIWDNFSNFEIAPGVTLKSRIQQIDGLTTDKTHHLFVDDISDVSSFHMGKIDAEHTQYQVKFDLNTVQDDPYLLSVHSFMNKELPSHVVSVAIKVNNADPFSVEFAYNSDGKDPDLMKYIPIDSSGLIEGENTITLEWQGATANATWLAWKNIEVSTPYENNVWSFARNETVNPKVLFGSEYRADDTYFVGAAISSFEQAVDKDVENFTDILFYTNTATAEYASLTLKALDTQKDANTNIQIFVNSAPRYVFNGSVTPASQITTPGFQLVNGWNRITIYHPGVSGAAPGEWIRWDGMSLTAANPSKFNPPQGLSAASLGSDKINLRWQVVNGIDVRYNIYRSQAKGGVYTKINSAPLISAQHQDAGLANNTVYYYTVTAYADADPSTESDRSVDASKTTGAYDVDYRDGRDPNSFGGDSSPQFTYFIMYRHDWTDGAVRKVTLSPQESGWIGLAGINVSQANALSIWIYGTGTEKIEVGLQNAGSGPSTFTVTASAGWQNLQIKLSDFSGISPVNLDKLSIKNISSGAVTIFLDDISFINDAAGTATLDVAAKNVNDNLLSTGMSFDNDMINSYAPANQYLAVSYNSPSAVNWKIWIYTKNDNGDPQYLDGQYNGLMSSDGRSRIALMWRIYPTIQQGGITCRVTSDVYSDAKMTWNYIKDRNDSDWAAANPAGAEYSVAAFGRKNEWAYIAPVPPGLGDRNPVNNTFYVYLGGEFGSANPGDYSARIYFDITHE